MAMGESATLLPHRPRRPWGVLARGAGAVALVALAGALVAGFWRPQAPGVRLSRGTLRLSRRAASLAEADEVGAAIVNSLFGKRRRSKHLQVLAANASEADASQAGPPVHVWKPYKIERGGVNVGRVGGWDVAQLIRGGGDYQAGHNLAPAGGEQAESNGNATSNETSGASDETYDEDETDGASELTHARAAWWHPAGLAAPAANATAPPANETSEETESEPEFSEPAKMEWQYGGMTRELGTRPHYTRSLPGVNVNGNPMCGMAWDGHPLDCDTNAWESDEGEDFEW